MSENITAIDLNKLSLQIKEWSSSLGFQQTGITDIHLGVHKDRFLTWLNSGYYGDMHYMTDHGDKRYTPESLVEGTCRIISVRMNYFPEEKDTAQKLSDPAYAYISRYALGRDYHKLMRKRLQQLATLINKEVPGSYCRPFVDSAPVLERGLAQKAGLGWFGKNAMIIHRSAGSWFFLGELFINVPLPVDPPYEEDHCGRCTSCIDLCPTNAIIAPHTVDARRCISYLTIENKDSIPEEFRKQIGNRIFGCDDCQLVCPWNRFGQTTKEQDFKPRSHLSEETLINLFAWDEATFLSKTEGTAIRRTGHECWLRNIAVALGNCPTSEVIITALQTRAQHPSALVREHVQWALSQHTSSHRTC